MIRAATLASEAHLSTRDMIRALADLDAAAVLIGTPAGARIAASVTLARRELLEELLEDAWGDERWRAFVHALADLLPNDVSLWTVAPGEVVTVPIRPALQRWMAI